MVVGGRVVAFWVLMMSNMPHVCGGRKFGVENKNKNKNKSDDDDEL